MSEQRCPGCKQYAGNGHLVNCPCVAWPEEIAAAQAKEKQVPAREGDAENCRAQQCGQLEKKSGETPAGPGLRLEVGKSYRTRGGWKATVKRMQGPFPPDQPAAPFLVKDEYHQLQDRGHVMTGEFNGEAEPRHECDCIAPWPSAADIPEGFEDTGEFRAPKSGELILRDGWANVNNNFRVHHAGGDYPNDDKRHILRKKSGAGQEAVIPPVVTGAAACTQAVRPAESAPHTPTPDHSQQYDETSESRRGSLSFPEVVGIIDLRVRSFDTPADLRRIADEWEREQQIEKRLKRIEAIKALRGEQ